MPDARTNSSAIDRALADILLAAYKGKRMSQATLVEKTGITVATMQRLMAGKTRFDVEQLFAIAEAIGTKTAAEYLREAEEQVAAEGGPSVAPDNVTRISTKRGEVGQWQGEQHAREELDAVAKDTVIEISPDDVTP